MFAQESVMDFQNIVTEQDTETLDAEIAAMTAAFTEEHYLNNDEAEHLEMIAAKSMVLGELYERAKWQAKAQAVPEGFVVVAKELPEKIAEKMAIDRIDKPIHENDPVWSEIAEESYKNQVKLKKWEFWRDYKAMIEAQEPANEL